jgi:uncharacterized membrane protein YkvA (DUF1232 family)
VAITLIFPQLSSEIRRILNGLQAEALVPVTVLSSELEQYASQLDQQAKESEFFDLDTATRTAHLCRKLLAALPQVPDEHQHRLTQLAVNYFVLEEDAEDDSESLIGFDDDLQVVVAVIEELGLNHLLKEGSADG